ncbi:MAG: response regulator transcription factor [Planctomycetota bacterium]|nr:response regulator transcription factor [Planctomycetota bacterium]MDA1249280.1 response regulator transcription factor [Planctomycetota bacterium]
MEFNEPVSQDRGVVILESHLGVRSFLRRVVTDTAGVSVVGEAGDGGSARRLLEQTPNSIIVTDPLLRPFGAFDLVDSMKENLSGSRVVVYSRDKPVSTIIDQSLRLNASIVSGEDSPEEIQAAIEAARDGEAFYSASVRKELITSDGGKLRVAVSDTLKTLTPKRLALLLLMAWGYSVKEPSLELKVSVKAVDSQLDRLRKGLGIRNRVDLAMLCLREGLINGHVECFTTSCPRCLAQIHLGIAQWIQAGRKRLEVSCRECAFSWSCQREQIQRRPFDGETGRYESEIPRSDFSPPPAHFDLTLTQPSSQDQKTE